MSERFLVCGDNEVREYEAADGDRVEPEARWRWQAGKTAGLDDTSAQLFVNIDECKPVSGGRQVLITSSWKGGAGLIDRADGVVRSCLASGNAHSAEMLPGSRLALASSEGRDLLTVHDLAGGSRPLYSDGLHHAHGAVWDEPRKLLWALGYHELRAYSLVRWETDQPSLVRNYTAKLPSENGHDLAEVPDSPLLSVTTGNRVYLFDRDRREFTPHPLLGDLSHVKAVSVNHRSGRIAYIQADQGEWRSRTVRFLNPAGSLALPDLHAYKVRWM